MLDKQLLSLSVAFSDAYPIVSDYGSALKLAHVQVSLFFSSNRNAKSHEEKAEEYFNLLESLCAKDTDLWCKIFCFALILSNYCCPRNIDDDNELGRRRFFKDYSEFLCGKSLTSGIIDADDESVRCVDAVDESGTAQEGFHAFVVSTLSTELQDCPEDVALLLDTLFRALRSIKYESLQFASGGVTCLQQSSLFHVLHRVLASSPAHSSLWTALLTDDFRLLETVAQVILNTPTTELRSRVVKLLFACMVEAMHAKPAACFSFAAEAWVSLVQPLLALRDLPSASIAACCLVELIVALPPPSPSSSSSATLLSDSMWHFICLCMNDGNAIVRRRGAHLMQKISLHAKACATGALSVPPFPEQRQPRMPGSKKTKEELKADKLKRKQQKNKYSEADEAVRPALFSGGEGLGAGAWPLLFLDVYQQMEGCTSMHLLAQVWPQLNMLMSLASDAEKNAGEGIFAPPPLCFAWVKVLLNCCLQSQMAPVKKLIMHEILSGKLPIPMWEQGAVEWFCEEFLAAVDTPALFITDFAELRLERLWQQQQQQQQLVRGSGAEQDICGAEKGKEKEEREGAGWQEEEAQAQRSPGTLIAVFMGRWVCVLAGGDGSRSAGASAGAGASADLPLLHVFLASLLRRVSACNSSQAIKWILRCFSFPVVQAALLSGDSQKGIFRITSSSLQEIRSLVKEKMLCANVIIRRQIYEGLVNFVVRCCFEEESPGSDDDASLKLKLFLEILEAFGVREAPLVAQGWTHLARALRECVASISPAAFASLEPSQLAVIFGVTGAARAAIGKQNVSSAQVDDMFFTAGQLYTSPYVDPEKQLLVVTFVQCSVSFLHRVCLVRGEGKRAAAAAGAGGGAGGGRWLCGESYEGGADGMLRGLIASGGALVDYSCFLLCALLDTLAAPAPAPAPGAGVAVNAGVGGAAKICSVLELNNHLDMLCEMLELSFACWEEGAAGLAGKLLTSLLSLLKHATLSLEDMSGREDVSAPPFAVLMHVQVASRVLQSINKLQLLHLQACNGEQKELKGFVEVFDLHAGAGAGESECGGQCAATARRVVLAVSRLQAPPPSLFQAAVAAIKAAHDDNDNGPASFVESAAAEYPQYGRFCAASLSSTWTALSAGLKLLQSCKAAQESDVAISTVLLLLEAATEDLSIAAAATVPCILDSCKLLVQSAAELLPSTEDELLSLSARVTESVSRMVEAAWTAVMSDDEVDFVAMQTFVLLCFDPAALHLLSTADQQQHFEAVSRVGRTNRPHVLQALVLQLCTVWRTRPSLARPFFPYFSRLLLYREPILDDHNRVDGTPAQPGAEAGGGASTETIFTVTESSRVLGIDKFHVRHITRVLLLDFLETRGAADEEVAACVRDLISELVDKNTQAGFRATAMIGTELFGEKLRCWQALCVLSRYVTEPMWLNISEVCFAALMDPCAHGIRVHLEIFFAAMAAKFTDTILPQLLDLLLVFNHSQQALSSYFVILGHLTVELQASQSPHHRLLLNKYSERMVSALLPWATCSPGLPRAVAQLLAYRLIPAVPSSSPPVPDPKLQEIWRFLHENTDINKLCRKQMSFFETYSLAEKCSVAGLLSVHCDEWGERVPPHILHILLQAMREHSDDCSEANVGGSSFATTINRNLDCGGSDGDVDDMSDVAAAFQLQTKITPFDNLQLALDSSTLTRQNTATDRPRQDLVVVASLIDKVTNLAGIARTCEIFAVKELVLSDLSVVASHDFQSISVASADWMPMREVAYRTNQSREMICYLREMKAAGYQIVGIEQTGVSVALGSSTPLAARCVLVLGKEKEGIPVELLQEVDLCVEIPQFGLTRSLNVHVSAALAIWEATKRNMKLK